MKVNRKVRSSLVGTGKERNQINWFTIIIYHFVLKEIFMFLIGAINESKDLIGSHCWTFAMRKKWIFSELKIWRRKVFIQYEQVNSRSYSDCFQRTINGYKWTVCFKEINCEISKELYNCNMQWEEYSCSVYTSSLFQKVRDMSV